MASQNLDDAARFSISSLSLRVCLAEAHLPTSEARRTHPSQVPRQANVLCAFQPPTHPSLAHLHLHRPRADADRLARGRGWVTFGVCPAPTCCAPQWPPFGLWTSKVAVSPELREAELGMYLIASSSKPHLTGRVLARAVPVLPVLLARRVGRRLTRRDGGPESNAIADSRVCRRTGVG